MHIQEVPQAQIILIHNLCRIIGVHKMPALHKKVDKVIGCIKPARDSKIKKLGSSIEPSLIRMGPNKINLASCE